MRLRSQNGFTLIEVATVTSCLAIIAPLVWMLGTRVTASQAAVSSTVDGAQSMRDLSEELRSDLATMHVASGGAPNAVELEGTCGRVTWQSAGGSLVREGGTACGGRRVIATNVASFSRTLGVIEIHFAPIDRGGASGAFFRFGLPEGVK